VGERKFRKFHSRMFLLLCAEAAQSLCDRGVAARNRGGRARHDREDEEG
jgi:uncharacterized protein (DUF488 family)